MNKYRKGNSVVILSGKDKGKSGTIEKVFPKTSKILVENINVVKKHVKPTKETEGGIKEISLPFAWSKAKVLDAANSSKSTSKSAESTKKVKSTKTSKK